MCEQEQIAFHESGHAVVYHYFRHPINSVGITAEGGCCEVLPEYDVEVERKQTERLMRREALLQSIIGVLAGKCTMDRWYARSGKGDHKWNWKASDDYRQAFQYALRLNGGDATGAELLLAWLERRTELLVEKQWPQIHKLAFQLLDKVDCNGDAKLSGEQIRKALAA
jgi:hypothetical protein